MQVFLALFFWIILSVVLFIAFVFVVILGLIKKNRKLIFPSVVLFICLIVSVVLTLKKFANISKVAYSKVSNALKSRSGEEIYLALFGTSQNECVKVLEKTDQLIPRIDDAIYLHFTTCPAELNRILNQNQYSFRKTSTKDFTNQNWWKPQTLGDSALFFEYVHPDGRRVQQVYSSADSSEVYYKDIFD